MKKTKIILSVLALGVILTLAYFFVPRSIRGASEVKNTTISLTEGGSEWVKHKPELNGITESLRPKITTEMYEEIGEEAGIGELLKDVKVYPSLKGVFSFGNVYHMETSWSCMVNSVLKQKEGEEEPKFLTVIVHEDGHISVSGEGGGAGLMTLGVKGREKAKELRDKLMELAKKHGTRIEDDSASVKEDK